MNQIITYNNQQRALWSKKLTLTVTVQLGKRGQIHLIPSNFISVYVAHSQNHIPSMMLCHNSTCRLQLFWGHFSDSIYIFRLQEKIITITMGCRSSDSCRKLFNLEILPLLSQNILSLILFMIRNMNQFLINSEVYHIDTGQHENFYQPSVK
jgi:hypothetical protein